MDSSHLLTVPLDPSKTAISFPPHHRRPLLSRTYRTLVGFLSHCRTTAPQHHSQVDNDHSESRSMGAENGSTTNDKMCSTDLLVQLACSKESENKLIQETYAVENNGNCDQEGRSSDKDVAAPKLNIINSIPDSNEEVAPASTNNIGDVLMVENQTNGFGIHIAKNQENCNVADIKMDEFGVSEQIEVDKELSVDDFSEMLDSCFGMDNVVQSSNAIERSQESGIVLEDNSYKGSEHESQLKEMELEKLINNSGVVEPTFCPNGDEEIEEGEISGEVGVADASEDVSQEERTTEMVQATQADHGNEKLICNDYNSGYEVSKLADPSLVEIVDSNNICMKEESRTTAGQMKDCYLWNVIGIAETQKSGSIKPCAENLTSIDKIAQESAADSHISASSRKDEEAEIKKKKRGPLTKERRDKKKKKERIKRAEKNRKLGVKRLKLPPVLKQKKIVYCRHYLQGRCHEGGKCNFSHDTVPFTKSKPCGHFARHSCMKGGDCPFDHELLKYPCKNYASNGFCSRGSDCLFSHEIPDNNVSLTPYAKPDSAPAQHAVPVKEGSFTTPKDAKPDLKLPTPLTISNSNKPLNKFGCFNQNVDTKSYPAGSALHTNADPVPRTAGKAPKGVKFLLNGGTSFGDSSWNTHGGSSLKTGDGVHVGCKSVEVPGSINKLNEMSERVPPSKPRGINFLSFAQPISDDSSSKMFSNVLSNLNGNGKSVVDEASEGKLTGSLPKSVGTLQVNRLVNQSAVSLQQDANKKDDESPMTILRSINFSPFDKTPLDTKIFKKQASLDSGEGDTALSVVKERDSVVNKLDNSIKLPSLSFSGSGNQSAGGKNSEPSSLSRTSCLPNTPSSVQKAVQSALAYAAKFEPAIKVRSSLHQGGS